MKKILLTLVITIFCIGSSLLLFSCTNGVSPTGISFKQEEIELVKNGSITVSSLIKVEPYNASNYQIDFTSSNKEIATVERRGAYLYISAVDYGSALITATIRGSELSSSILVKVTEGKVNDMYVDENAIIKDYYEGQTFSQTKPTVWARFESGTSKQVDYGEYELFITRAGEKLPINTPLQIGDILTISYFNYDYDIVLNVQEDFIASLEVVSPPQKQEYYIGDYFDSTAMVVEAVYVSGRREVITDYSFEVRPLDYNDKSITICYQDIFLDYPLSISANISVSNYSLLQEAIDNASIGDSIMLSGKHNYVNPIYIPLEKNLIIFGEPVGGLDVSITGKENSSIFIFTGQGNCTLANISLFGNGNESTVISYQGNSDISDSNITLENISINSCFIGIEFSLQSDDQINNIVLNINNTTITSDGYGIRLVGLKDSKLVIKESQIESQTAVEGTNILNFSINIDDKEIIANDYIIIESLQNINEN